MGQLSNFAIIAQQQPELLEALGTSSAFILDQLQKLEEYNRRKSITSVQKLSFDQEKWKNWLITYKKRLLKELDQEKDWAVIQENRITLMNNNNPKFILRNYIAQNCIEKAEKGD